MEAEFLARISRRQRLFLTRSAVLERMSGSLCEAVLELPGSAATLAELARSNLLLVPLDRRGKWYRYHHLFRDMLLAELERLEPGLVPVLRRRAAGWCLANGRPEEAMEYSIAARDVDRTAQLAGDLVLQVYRQGRVTTLGRWFRWLDERDGIEGHPMTAVAAAFFAAETGRPVEAERWADAVDRWQRGAAAWPADPPAEAWAAALRAMMCRGGVEQMRADADEAARRFTAAGIVAPVAQLCQGIARALSGDLDGSDAFFAYVASVGEEDRAAEVLTDSLCERSLLAAKRGQWTEAEAFASQARSVMRRAGIENIYATPLVCAVQARAVLHRGDVAAARQQLISAQRLRPLLTYTYPHFAVAPEPLP